MLDNSPRTSALHTDIEVRRDEVRHWLAIRKSSCQRTCWWWARARGLAVGACLRRAGVDFILLEKEQALAPSWRRHYERLHLHTDRAHSGLPYFPMPRSFPRYPSREQVIEYLEAYAEGILAPPHFGEDVLEARQGEGAWELKTPAARYRTRAVVLATGYDAAPVRPTWPGLEVPGCPPHSSEYRSGERSADRTFWWWPLAIRAGKSPSTCSSTGRARASWCEGVNLLPRELLELPILTWAALAPLLPESRMRCLRRSCEYVWKPVAAGLRKAPAGPLTELSTRRRVPLIDVGTVALIRRKSVQLRPRIAEFTPDGVRFEDGTEGTYPAVVLATGYHHQLAGVLGNLDGVSMARAGRHQRSRDSGTGPLPVRLLCRAHRHVREAGIEARRIVDRLSQRLRAPGSRVRVPNGFSSRPARVGSPP